MSAAEVQFIEKVLRNRTALQAVRGAYEAAWEDQFVNDPQDTLSDLLGNLSDALNPVTNADGQDI